MISHESFSWFHGSGSRCDKEGVDTPRSSMSAAVMMAPPNAVLARYMIDSVRSLSLIVICRTNLPPRLDRQTGAAALGGHELEKDGSESWKKGPRQR